MSESQKSSALRERCARALPALAGSAVVALGLALSAPAQAQATDAPDAAPQQKAAATVAALSISGNSAFSGSQLQRVMGIKAAGLFSRGDDYSKARLASAQADLRAFYISRGYFKFSVKKTVITPSADGKTVSINITVDEGKLYTLASVKLSGDDMSTLAGSPGMVPALQRALPLRQPVTREGLETARRALLAQLSHEGYTQASVSPRFTTDDANGLITLTFEITRGQIPAQTHPVQEETVTSIPAPPVATPPKPESAAQPPTPAASATQPQQPPVTTPPPTPVKTSPGIPTTPSQPAPSTPTASPPQPPGTPSVQTPPAPPAPPASQPAQAEQKFDLADEQRAIKLRASVGYSSTDRVIGMLSARYLNGLGKGHDLAAEIAGGRTYQGLRLSETDRWFTPGGVSRATSFWYQSNRPFYYLNDHSNFRSSGMGLSERFDIPLSAANSIYLAPGIEHDWLSRGRLTPQAYLNRMDRDGSVLNVVTLRAGLTHDMRDSASVPTRGYILQGNTELGVGNASYIQAYAAGHYYHPLWGSTVLSLSGLGGVGQGIGSHGYPIQKFFYAGGADSVRGYRGNSLGPRDSATGFPLGGRRLLVGSVEADTPLSPLLQPNMPGRLVWLLFVDGGNVWSPGLGSAGVSSAGPVRFSYGTGLGWQIPYGMLKLNFALPVNRHAGDNYQRFQFEFNAGF